MRTGKFRMKKKRFIILLLCAAVLVVGILVAVLRPKRPVLYRVTYLPSLGGQFTLPCSINDNGQIAGFSVWRGTYHLFLWDCEKDIQGLGPISKIAATNSCIYINNSGQIAATMHDPNGNERAFIWDPNRGRCILPTLGGKSATANGINNHGHVVGAAETASGVLHAFVWDAANGIRDLTSSSTVNTQAWSINDVGQVVVYAPNLSGTVRLVSIDEGETSTSPLIPVIGPREINNNGYVTGIVRTAQGKFDIGIWHPNSGVTRLLGLNTDSPCSCQMSDVNQVVFTKDRRVFRLYARGRTLFSTAAKHFLDDPKRGRISLDKYVSIGEDEDFCLTDINNKGCIIGAIQSTKHTYSCSVLLEPIPEQWNKK